MRIPCSVRYKNALQSGRPMHTKFDEFYARHPFMDTRKRAKIFAPFDALAGFDELILSKEVSYVEKEELGEERVKELDIKLHILGEAVKNSRDAAEKELKIGVTYYIPCTDILNDAYGVKGRYVTATGTLRKVDTVLRYIQIDDIIIDLDDISDIDTEISSDDKAS